MEALPAVTNVLLDKTGTLTDTSSGHVAQSVGEAQACLRMEALVGHSGHPLARALRASATVPASVRIVPGKGVEGSIDGVQCRAGSPEWIDGSGARWDAELDDE